MTMAQRDIVLQHQVETRGYHNSVETELLAVGSDAFKRMWLDGRVP
jgi:hypothetical protein